MMITDHPRGSLPADHADDQEAAAIPARGCAEDRQVADPGARGPPVCAQLRSQHIAKTIPGILRIMKQPMPSPPRFSGVAVCPSGRSGQAPDRGSSLAAHSLPAVVATPAGISRVVLLSAASGQRRQPGWPRSGRRPARLGGPAGRYGGPAGRDRQRGCRVARRGTAGDRGRARTGLAASRILARRAAHPDRYGTKPSSCGRRLKASTSRPATP